ncbi:MAG: Holliday junction branch migration protein RuvA, partial [Anaerolineales bacterium]|nr:Holliday junction branch migration protein RuvA [Anaerolineales bacterium]
MIASLRGQVQEISSDNIVVEIAGVGLQVNVPLPLRDGLRPGENIFLYTYLVVREDSLSLYGFDTKDAREYFVLLISVNGVGPRLALAALSTLTTDAIRRAVFHEQAEVFTRVPGIGKRTAQKILLHLQDRIPAEPGLEPVSGMSDTDTEVLEALTTLGYSVVEAQAALQAIP